MHKENGIAEQCLTNLAIMKGSLLINSGLLVNLWVEAIDTVKYLCN